jgi:DNA-binding GntR family transcriptional regulator
MSTSLAYSFAPVHRESSREIVSASIREAILDGTLPVGQRLREVHLAQQFEVSRPVVREALQALSYEGLVEISSFKGASVVDLTAQQVDEMLGLRLMLEPEAVRLAKPRLKDRDNAHLHSLARAMTDGQATAQSTVQLDLELHETIWRLSGNATLAKHLILLTRPLFAFGVILRHSRLVSDTGQAYRIGDHIELVGRICDGSVREAVEAMQSHIRENWGRTRAAVERLHSAPAKTARKSSRA